MAVDFWTKWCAPYLKIGEVLPVTASESPKVTFLNLDVDQNRELQTHSQINSIRHPKFFKFVTDGGLRELASVRGADVAQINAKISQFG
jgi:thioredoxin-like negative regulator of GroEL